MEESFAVQRPEKQKLNGEQDIHGNSKCLGSLPDAVLLHILSYLPTKDAVRMSVLSKRWEYVWTYLPHLWFELTLSDNRTLFMNFVERVLCLHDADIERFTLSCEVPCDASRVNSWLSAAVRKNVKELSLSIAEHEGTFSWPKRLFNHATLINLYIEIPHLAKLPRTICFSSLKMLTIKEIVFRDEGLTQKVFSALPVLEKLYLEDCSWEFIKVLSISAPRLHFLSISEIQTENLGYCQIMIFGDCLKEFVYYGHLLIDYCLYNSLSLETADIDLVPCEIISKEISYRVHKLLVGVCNVKYLTLSSEVIQFLGDAPELLPHMPVFNNLLDLAFMESEAVDLSDAGLLRILHNAPCLRTLKFAEGISFNSFWDNDDGILDSVPPCFMSHLKRINVFHYGGHELNLLAVKILLKNAVKLEKMIITGLKHISGDFEEQTRIRQQLLELPRGSQYCEFVLK